MVIHVVCNFMLSLDTSTASSWLGWASSITSAASHNKTNPTTAGSAPPTSGKELKTTIKSDNDKENKDINVEVEKTSDEEEQDDDHWEDGGWGEEVGEQMKFNVVIVLCSGYHG